MKLTIIGKGRVGTAFASLCENAGFLLEHFEFVDEYGGGSDFLFLAIPDSAVHTFLQADKSKATAVVHFAAALGSHGAILLHPYASITPDTDLTQILFTLWGERNSSLEELLHALKLSFYYGGEEIDALYHASAVFAGNFTQILHEMAVSMLEMRDIPRETARELVTQLVATSGNTIGEGIKGFTGPIARGDSETIKKELELLKKELPGTAKLFEILSIFTTEGLKNGNILH